MKNLILYLILALCMVSCVPKGLDSEANAPIPETEEVTGTTSQIGEVTDYSSVPDPNSSVTIDSGTSYWYIYCNTNGEMERFAIIEINGPEFSLVQAHEKIMQKWPGVTNDQYIGITFFAPVTKRCYDEYMAAD